MRNWSIFLSISVLLAGILLTIEPSWAAPADRQRVHRLNMKNVDLPLLIGDVAAITGNTFSIHPKVRGKATIISPTNLTRDEVFSVFTATLRTQNYSLVPVGPHSYAIVPEKQAASFAPPRDGDPIRTEVVPLSFIGGKQAADLVKPLLEPNGVARALEGTRLLVLIGYSSSIKNAREALEKLDQDRTVTRAIALVHIGAAEAARLVNGLRQTRGSKTYAADVSALSANGSNTLLVHGAPDDVERMAEIVAQIDMAAAEAKSSVSVITLNHAKAADLKPILEQLITSQGTGASGSSPSVSVYEPGNALVLSAAPDLNAKLTDVVIRLDRRQPQVLVEAIIVEVTDSKARELGVQLALAGGPNSGLPVLASNFSSAPASILSLAGALLLPDSTGAANVVNQSAALSSLAGRSSTLVGAAVDIGNGGLFGAILNAVATDTRSRVLSTPSVLTLDNQEARILVGQEIPVTSGEVLGSTNSNPFRTVTRQDVGVELVVTPQISSNNTIRMEVEQIVSSVGGPVSATSDEIITNKREIKTTILAEDGEVIVLGGLVQESDTTTSTRVPLLGDIPFLGALFRNKGKEAGHTNLMVFLRPVIIRDHTDALDETNRSILRSGLQSEFDPESSSTIIDSTLRNAR